MENTEEICEMIWKIWKKSKLKCEKILKMWKKSRLNSEKIWKIWKKSKLKSEKIWEIWKKSKLNDEKRVTIQKKRMGQHCAAIYIDSNSKGEYYDPTRRPPFLTAYVNFMKKHCHSWTYNTVRVQEEGSTEIVYLIHRCAGHSIDRRHQALRNSSGSDDHCKEICFVTC